MPNQYETKDMTGVLFVEETRKTDKHPDFSGNVTIGGKEYRLAGWKHMSKNGKRKLIQLKASIPQPKAAAQPSRNSNSW